MEEAKRSGVVSISRLLVNTTRPTSLNQQLVEIKVIGSLFHGGKATHS